MTGDVEPDSECEANALNQSPSEMLTKTQNARPSIRSRMTQERNAKRGDFAKPHTSKRSDLKTSHLIRN